MITMDITNDVRDSVQGELEGTADRPVLVACSHGTDNEQGRAIIRDLVAAVRDLLPDVEVLETYVDVQYPQVDEVVGSVAPDRGVVIVPLLLSGGFHVHVDIAAAVQARVGPTVAARALGPDERLATILVERLVEAGARPEDSVVVAAAGSSDERAARDVEQVVEAVAGMWHGPVSVGYASAAVPRVGVATDLARASLGGPAHGRVVVASYLLAPGFFLDGLARVGAEVVSAPLGAHPLLAQIVVDRYRSAAVALARA